MHKSYNVYTPFTSVLIYTPTNYLCAAGIILFHSNAEIIKWYTRVLCTLVLHIISHSYYCKHPTSLCDLRSQVANLFRALVISNTTALHHCIEMKPSTLHQIKGILTRWGPMTHIYTSINLAIIGSDNGLSPGRRQAIIWPNTEILLIGPLGTIFSEIWIKMHTFSFKEMYLNMSSAKWRPFCLGPKVLMNTVCSSIVHRNNPW